MTAVLRAHAALKQAGLINPGKLVRAPNSMNEVWFVDRFVLRINPDLERPRLFHERNVLGVLPPEVPAPRLLDYGQGPFGEWLLLQRVPGEELSRTWIRLSPSQRQTAITALGEAMRHLHQVNAAKVGLAPPPFLSGDTLDCPHQLPADRLLDLLARAALLRYVDRAVLRAAVDLVLNASDALDATSDCLVHGDLHLENVLVDDWALTALVDFEWTRTGPPDLDLDVLLHSLADPALHVGTDYTAMPKRSDFDHVTQWLRGAYPELFSHPRLVDRLTVYRLSYDTRALLQQPPDRAPDLLSPHHPYRRLQRVVEGRSDLGWILAG